MPTPRIRRTKSGKGKLVRTLGRQGHFRRKRRKSRKRLFYQMTPVNNKGLRNRIRRLLPKSRMVNLDKI